MRHNHTARATHSEAMRRTASIAMLATIVPLSCIAFVMLRISDADVGQLELGESAHDIPMARNGEPAPGWLPVITVRRDSMSLWDGSFWTGGLTTARESMAERLVGLREMFGCTMGMESTLDPRHNVILAVDRDVPCALLRQVLAGATDARFQVRLAVVDVSSDG